MRELVASQGVRPSRSLGQNFVVDPNTIRKMMAVAQVGPGDHVLEIGAGAGSLTVGLAGAAGRVTALEVDPRLVRVLERVTERLANVEVVEADARGFDLASTGAGKMVANLPYNIAALLVLKVLEEAPGIADLTVMTQREVAERLAAPPGSKIYGRTSVMLAYFASARLAGTVSRNAFWPIPRVDSAIVTVERRPMPDVEHEVFRRVVRAAFSQRRKTLRHTIASLMGSPAAAVRALAAAGVAPDERPEQLGLDPFVKLARAVEEGAGP